MILIISFIGMLFLSFIVMAFFSGSLHNEKAAKRRLGSIIHRRDGGNSSPATMELILKINSKNKPRWLDGVLHKYKYVQKLEATISLANISMTISILLLSSLGLAILGFIAVYLCVSLWMVQILTTCVLGYIPFGVILFKSRRRLAAFNAGLPDAIDMMGRALRAGHSMVASMSTVAEQSAEPVKSEFCEVFKQQNFGLPLRDALTQMLDRVPSQDLKVLVTGILVQKETGGNMAEILDRTSGVIRERLRIQGEIRTHTAQGRMTGWILCSLPVALLIIINFVNPGYSDVLLNTQIGHLLICAGLGLLIIGAAVIRSIINGIEV